MRGTLHCTRRTTTGFGEATNDSILAALGVLRERCENEVQYLNIILALTTTPKSYLLQLPDELLLQIGN
jgi:hypothetical protein